MIFQSLKQGFSKVNSSKRMVFFAWAVNVGLSLVLALLLITQLDSYISGTIREEQLLERMDANWYQTYQLDFQQSELAKLFDYSIFGYAPFLNHLEVTLNGTVVKNIGRFLYDLIFRIKVNFEYSNLLVGMSIVYLLVSTFLAGAFIGVYSKDHRMNFTEFLIEGAKHFGRFFRLSLLALIVNYLLFIWLFDWATNKIPEWTANSPSEVTPFIYYMIKNAAVLFILAVVAMCFDYAKVRIVAEDRISALVAMVAGARFALSNFGRTFGLYLILTLIGVGLIALYALIENRILQSTYWTIIIVFIVQQAYMMMRFWLKASFYAGQVALYQGASSPERVTTSTQTAV